MSTPFLDFNFLCTVIARFFKPDWESLLMKTEPKYWKTSGYFDTFNFKNSSNKTIENLYNSIQMMVKFNSFFLQSHKFAITKKCYMIKSWFYHIANLWLCKKSCWILSSKYIICMLLYKFPIVQLEPFLRKFSFQPNLGNNFQKKTEI